MKMGPTLYLIFVYLRFAIQTIRWIQGPILASICSVSMVTVYQSATFEEFLQSQAGIRCA